MEFVFNSSQDPSRSPTLRTGIQPVRVNCAAAGQVSSSRSADKESALQGMTRGAHTYAAGWRQTSPRHSQLQSSFCLVELQAVASRVFQFFVPIEGNKGIISACSRGLFS